MRKENIAAYVRSILPHRSRVHAHSDRAERRVYGSIMLPKAALSCELSLDTIR